MLRPLPDCGKREFEGARARPRRGAGFGDREELMPAQPRKHPRSAARARKAALRYRVARAADLAPGQSRKFMLPIEGVEEECFLINFRGEFHAYVNRCRHIPIPMDWVDNHFFDEGGHYLMCQTHGALYQPSSGECLAGPAGACGKYLFRIPLEVERDVIYARPPDDPIDPGL
jgi:nitrite reductase/ring-hydroxylating ferredoxin subunit